MRSLRRKFLLAALFAHAVVAAAVLLAVNRLLDHALETQVQQSAERSRALLAASLEPLLIERDLATAQELLQSLVDHGSFVYVQTVDRDDRPVVNAGPVPSPMPPLFDGSTVEWWEIGAWRDQYHFEAKLEASGQLRGRVRFGIAGHPVAAAKEGLLLRLLVIGAAGLALAAALQWVLARGLTRRLEDLAAAADRVAAGEQGLQLHDRGRDEAARLAQSFNRMSEALRLRFDALQASERHQRELTEALAEGVVFRDENGQVVSCNMAAERILGLSREQLIGAAPVDAAWSAIRPDGAAFDFAQHPSLLASRSGTPVRDVLMGVHRPDGTRVWVSINAQPILAPGRAGPHATVTSFNDVTARIEAERELEKTNAQLEQRVADRTAELARARDVAQDASRAKSEFLSRMSHELRTPLNAILGFAQLLRMRLKSGPPEVDDQLGHIEAAGWHLLELINDVLDLSRIETGSLAISDDATELAPIVAECVRMAQPSAAEHQVGIEDRCAEMAPTSVRADATRLRQVLVNLLTNACKYNRPGGSVRVSARRDGEWVNIEIQDSGIGLSQEQLESLFQPFNRLGAENRGIEGTGIGLVITRSLVELMGGTLSVQSARDEGSTFTVRLRIGSPPALPRGAGQDVHASTTWTTGRQTVLYVEDNPSNVKVLEELLRMRGGVVLKVATDGREAFRMATVDPPDAMVIDIALPGMDGLSLCRRLRATPSLAHLPIVALSANAMPRDRTQGMEAGFDQYFTKPIDIEPFMQWLNRSLERPS